jgi:hypothetical protein
LDYASSSWNRRTPGASGFFTLIHDFDGPDRYAPPFGPAMLVTHDPQRTFAAIQQLGFDLLI